MAFKKKSALAPSPVVVPEVTPEQRIQIANEVASGHLAAFENAAAGLEATADRLDAIRDTASREASRQLAVKLEADAAAFKHRAQAQKIRELLS